MIEMSPEQPVLTTKDKYEWLIATGRYEHLRHLFEAFEEAVEREFKTEGGKDTIHKAANF